VYFIAAAIYLKIYFIGAQVKNPLELKEVL